MSKKLAIAAAIVAFSISNMTAAEVSQEDLGKELFRLAEEKRIDSRLAEAEAAPSRTFVTPVAI